MKTTSTIIKKFPVICRKCGKERDIIIHYNYTGYLLCTRWISEEDNVVARFLTPCCGDSVYIEFPKEASMLSSC